MNAAIQFMNAEVCFYEAGEDTTDDITGDGGVTIRLLWRGKARVQQLRTPQESTTDYQSSDTRTFRFQLDPSDSVPFLYSGTKARVIAGGRDPRLETLVFSVDSSINSSHRAVHTVQLAATMRPVDWAWAPDDPDVEQP